MSGGRAQRVMEDLLHFPSRAIGAHEGECPTVGPNLLVNTVTFGDNLPVERDTEGYFEKPEWDMNRAEDQQAPVCYKRGSTMKVTVELRVLGSRKYQGPVTVQGKTEIEGREITFSGTVTLTGAPRVTMSEVSAGAPLPDHVGCYDPLTIVWEATTPKGGPFPAGVSQHVVYTLLDAPQTTLYWTLIDISCRWGRGASSEEELLRLAYAAFEGRKLTRKRDNHELHYWIVGSPVGDMNRCPAYSTWALLHSRNGRGQCGSWAELCLDTFAVHGIVGKKIVIRVKTEVSNPQQRLAGGFLVKNWRYLTPPPTSPERFTHSLHHNCLDQPGLPGQQNPDPPPHFVNHFIAQIKGRYYDPSYGTSFADQRAWEAASMDGLMAFLPGDAMGGFHDSPEELMTFKDAPRAATRPDQEID